MEEPLQNSENSSEQAETKVAPANPQETKKSRKPLTEVALEKLKVAREKAAIANRAKKEERLRVEKEREEMIQATKDPILVVEQSESDEESLEAPPNVLIVRRKRPKPKVPEKSPQQVEKERLHSLHYHRMFG